ncbi:hypothetical protein RH858_00600 [Halalkaliarchaeum sp. AArc-GB]|uniref:hypothetical protein n=1 Tax=Halalkaliarchaeum sp. AArc-GB TaxID=3074078 RepID=UPI00285C9622|nr:hypothetical protein [Halalkaliarchaeum sp. AArc-GB]MDR5671655.1 hypothetical protein [Halalkaliarchaeum sp. AArc-GB]
MTGYYDHVLGLIPVSLIGITGILGAYGLPLSAAVFVGALPSLFFMLHALFVAAPTIERGNHSPVRRSARSAAARGEAGPPQAD